MKRLNLLKLGVLFVFFLNVTPVYSAGENFQRGWEYYQQGNFIDALQHWVPLATAGNAAAQFNLSTMYDDGKGVPRDLETARYWLEKSVQAGYGPALHNHGLTLLEQDRNEDAIKVIQKAADSGLPRSLYTLGKMYQYGLSIPENPEKAFKFISLAAQAGNDKAQYNLGKMYRDGYGIKKDDAFSAKWFEFAALQGNAKAQSHLATRYGKGVGVEQDDVVAMKWALLAARAGNKIAKLNLDALIMRMSRNDRDNAISQAKNFKVQKK